MNFKNMFAMTFVCAAVAFAQQAAPAAPATTEAPAPAAQPAVQQDAQQAAPAQPAAEQAAVSDSTAKELPKSETKVEQKSEEKPVEQVAEAPAKEEPVNKGPFDVLHGNAYNSVGNEAAADNVDALLGRPDKFFGQKFFYIEPAAERGVVSLGRFFAAMDVSGDVGRATAGYAAKGFGAEVRLGLGQYAIEGDNGKKSGSNAGDDWGFTVSKVLGNFVLALNTDWTTFAEENNVEPEVGKSVEENYRDLSVALSFSNAPSAVKHFWSAGVQFVRHDNEQTVGGDVKNEDVDSHIRIAPFFNYGTPALVSDRARLLLGLNTSVPVTMYDDQELIDEEAGDTVKTSLMDFGVMLSPNILGEVAVIPSLMLFGQASYNWRVFDYRSGTDATDDEYTAMESVANQVTATVGLRYQYQNLIACEFAFGDSFFTDTKSIFNGEGVFIKFGGFVYF
jgi:hypothetical protein